MADEPLPAGKTVGRGLIFGLVWCPFPSGEGPAAPLLAAIRREVEALEDRLVARVGPSL